MGGISQCPVCGELYYGDKRDSYQTCGCVTAARRKPMDVVFFEWLTAPEPSIGERKAEFYRMLAGAYECMDDIEAIVGGEQCPHCGEWHLAEDDDAPDTP